VLNKRAASQYPENVGQMTRWISEPAAGFIVSFALVIALWALFSGIVQIVHGFDLRALYDKWWLLVL
jgi:uncharacterized membrane protein HdeD (DUF308 family)